jgi:hypothetical protein
MRFSVSFSKLYTLILYVLAARDSAFLHSLLSMREISVLKLISVAFRASMI